MNARTNRPYTGELNTLILSCAETNAGYTTSKWLTEGQARDWGGWVRDGEKPTTIIFGRAGSTATGRGYGNLVRVYSFEQCGGLPPGPSLPDQDFVWTFPRLERLIARCGADFRIGGRHAFYHPEEDYIQVPPPSSFFQPTAFVRTCVHELCHWTKRSSRLDRKPLDAVKHVAAAREEVLVELATAYVLAYMRAFSRPTSPSYIKEWLRYAKADSTYLFEIAQQAREIAQYILGFERPGTVDFG